MTVSSNDFTSGYIQISNGVGSRVSERYLHPMFTAALFTTAKRRKPPKCPSTGGQIKEGGLYTYMQYRSALNILKENPVPCSVDET